MNTDTNNSVQNGGSSGSNITVSWWSCLVGEASWPMSHSVTHSNQTAFFWPIDSAMLKTLPAHRNNTSEGVLLSVFSWTQLEQVYPRVVRNPERKSACIVLTLHLETVFQYHSQWSLDLYLSHCTNWNLRVNIDTSQCHHIGVDQDHCKQKDGGEPQDTELDQLPCQAMRKT